MSLPYISLIIIMLSMLGCSLEVVVHDEDYAADLAKQHLTQFKSGIGVRDLYDNAHDSFKESTVYNEFDVFVGKIRSIISNRALDIVGYETFGGKQVIVVYAQSLSDTKSIFLKLSYLGSKSKEYKLVGLHINGTEYKKGGLYKEYRTPIRLNEI